MKARIVPVVAALLLCVACTRLAPSERAPVPAATTTQVVSQPTPVVVVSTTAKQLDPSAIATLNASPILLDVPYSKYLLLQATVDERLCVREFLCMPVDNLASWDELNLGEQRLAMRDMIRQGAEGFVDVMLLRDWGPAACTTDLHLREPIKELPFTWSLRESIKESMLLAGTLRDPHNDFAVTLYRVDGDGTITAQVGNVTYSFKPGDTWSYAYSLDVHQLGNPNECASYTYSYRLSFQNGGLMDTSQYLLLNPPPP